MMNVLNRRQILLGAWMCFVAIVVLPSGTATFAATPGEAIDVTWSCTSSPCPWGTSLGNPSLVWPAAMSPSSQRLGYTTSAPVYLPASTANGLTITINSGSATAYAGLPNAGSHRVVQTIGAGQTLTVPALASGEVLSIQSSTAFTYTTTVATTTTTAPTTTSPAPPTCTDPVDCSPVQSVKALWRCDMPGCTASDWVGAVITWPEWAAYPNNARPGSSSRTVYTEAGEILHPYMGAWADGCEVTAQSGQVLIIEWERGTNVWTEVWLSPGETHTISLTGEQDGAMIEAEDYSQGFSVVLNDCNPQPVEPS